MGRDMYHSAEGTHWTKKNHKYIRKEGNRYIYPSDVKTGAGGRARDIQRRKGVLYTQHTQGEEDKDRIDENYSPNHDLDASTTRFWDTKVDVRRNKNTGKLDADAYKTASYRNNTMWTQPETYRFNDTERSIGLKEKDDDILRNQKYNSKYAPLSPMSAKMRANKAKKSLATYKQGRTNQQAAGTEHATRVKQAKNRANAANGVGARNQEYAKMITHQRANKKSASNGSGARNQEFAKAATSKRASQASNRSYAGNGARNQEYGKTASKQRLNRVAASNGVGARNQEYAKTTTKDKRKSKGRKAVESLLSRFKKK